MVVAAAAAAFCCAFRRLIGASSAWAEVWSKTQSPSHRSIFFSSFPCITVSFLPRCQVQSGVHGGLRTSPQLLSAGCVNVQVVLLALRTSRIRYPPPTLWKPRCLARTSNCHQTVNSRIVTKRRMNMTFVNLGRNRT